MDDLLRRMISAKKSMQEKKHSRMYYKNNEQRSVSSLKEILSRDRGILKRSCIEKLDLSFIKTMSPKFTNNRVSNSSSIVLGRTYKLDAVKLIDSRVKQFLSKHIRIWKKNAEELEGTKRQKANNFEHFCLQSRVAVNLMFLFSKKISQTYRNFFESASVLNKYNKKSDKFIRCINVYIYKYCFRQIQIYSSFKVFATVLERQAKKIAFNKVKEGGKIAFNKVIEGKKKAKEVIMFQRDSVFLDDKLIVNELRGEVFNQLLTQKVHDLYVIFFKHCKQMIENRSIQVMLHQVSIEKAIRRIMNYYKFVQVKALNIWSKKASARPSRTLISVLDRTQRRKQNDSYQCFWLKSMLHIYKKSKSTKNIVQILDKELRNIFYAVKYLY